MGQSEMNNEHIHERFDKLVPKIHSVINHELADLSPEDKLDLARSATAGVLLGYIHRVAETLDKDPADVLCGEWLQQMRRILDAHQQQKSETN
jgi:hypothetical protein